MIEDCDVVNHADKNTPYFSGKSVGELWLRKCVVKPVSMVS